MEKIALRISEGILQKFGSQIKSVLSRTREDKIIEIIVLAKSDDLIQIHEEAHALAKQPRVKTEINILDSEEFFEKILDNDIDALENLRNSEIAADPTRFITPIKILVDSGKVFAQKELLEITAKARERFAHIDALKHEAIRKLFGAIVTASNAALLARGYSMPTIKDLPDSIRGCFVKHDLLEKKYAKICERVLDAYTKINSDKTVELWEFSQLSYETEMFIERMKTLIR